MAAIDILLPVKNGLAYLAEAIDSVRSQNVSDWRLLVLDHGSTDGSTELVERYARRDGRVQLHHFPQAEGLSSLLNLGLGQCDCRHVMRLDADDVCLPDRLDIALQAFAHERHAVVIGGQAELIDGAGRTIGQLCLPVGRARLTASSFFRNPLSHPALMMDFRAITALGARYGVDFLGAVAREHSLSVKHLAEDYFMFGQLAMLGKCVNLPQRLIRYRWHRNNVSVMRRSEQMAASLDISRFLARSFCVIHDLPPFDPAPFCNHGGTLFDMGGQQQFDDAFAAMALTLRTAMGPSAQLERELLFRRVLATRALPRMLSRYARFSMRSTPESGEWYAVKSWLLRRLPGKQCPLARTVA